MRKYTALAELLFELELERITNETPFHFEFNEWNESYGESSQGFVDDLHAKPEDVKTLAGMIRQDFDNGVWEPDEDGLYHYEMPSFYSDYITDKLSIQLALLTGIGYQTEIEFE
jgi:hypothetical protein